MISTNGMQREKRNITNVKIISTYFLGSLEISVLNLDTTCRTFIEKRICTRISRQIDGKISKLIFLSPFLSLKKKRKKKKLLLTPPRPNDSIERNKSWGSEHELGVELSDRTDREEGVR